MFSRLKVKIIHRLQITDSSWHIPIHTETTLRLTATLLSSNSVALVFEVAKIDVLTALYFQQNERHPYFFLPFPEQMNHQHLAQWPKNVWIPFYASPKLDVYLANGFLHTKSSLRRLQSTLLNFARTAPCIPWRASTRSDFTILYLIAL